MGRTADFENDRPSATYLKTLAGNRVDHILVPQDVVQETQKDVETLGLGIRVSGHPDHKHVKTEADYLPMERKANINFDNKRKEAQAEAYAKANHKRRFF